MPSVSKATIMIDFSEIRQVIGKRLMGREEKSHQSLFGSKYTTMPGPAFFQPSHSLCPSISDKGTIRRLRHARRSLTILIRRKEINDLLELAVRSKNDFWCLLTGRAAHSHLQDWFFWRALSTLVKPPRRNNCQVSSRRHFYTFLSSLMVSPCFQRIPD